MPEIEILPTDLTEQVAAFYTLRGYVARRGRPTKPSDVHRRELRQRLVHMTFAFWEVLEAFGVDTIDMSQCCDKAIDEAECDNDLATIARELAELDYTVEGTRLTLGIPRVPVATEVHRAHMGKVILTVPIKPGRRQLPKIAELLARERAAADD